MNLHETFGNTNFVKARMIALITFFGTSKYMAKNMSNQLFNEEFYRSQKVMLCLDNCSSVDLLELTA